MRTHALLSASGAHRWLNCTASARLEENMKDTTSCYAKEGSAEIGRASCRERV